jgi:medium-chain acyl-[acyl-carrier-protein] hydrolase
MTTFDVSVRQSLWIPAPRTGEQTAGRLFCFPYAGGGASAYRSWYTAVGGHIAVCPLQLPGRERRVAEPALTRLDRLVEEITEALRPHLEQPFAFYGHCLGALVCFEVARKLRSSNGPAPTHIFVSAHRPPQLPIQRRSLHRLPDVEFLNEIIEFNGIPEWTLSSPELLEMALPALRADFAMYETYDYTPQEPLEVPISVFGGLNDRCVTIEELAAWRDLTEQSFELRLFPGDHFFPYDGSEGVPQALQRKFEDYGLRL